MGYVEYNSNNSGGKWWLTDEDWKALEADGWIVAWASLYHSYTKRGDYIRESNGVPRLVPRDGTEDRSCSFGIEKVGENQYRYMGALAREAYLPDCTDIREAARRFDTATSCDSTDSGCPCCGQPHYFTSYDSKGTWLESGPSISYTCDWD